MELGFREGREHFVSGHNPEATATRWLEFDVPGGSEYHRGWRLAAQATIWEARRLAKDEG